MVDLHHRGRRDGFQLSLVARAAPLDRAIDLCGLYEVLPFEAAVDAVGRQPRAWPSDPQGGT